MDRIDGIEENRSSTTSTAEALVRRAYKAFNEHNVEAGVVLMDPDVEWPDVAHGGFVHGHEGVREHWREQFDQVDVQIETGEFRERPDGRLEAYVRQIVRSHDGIGLSDSQVVHIFTIANKLIKRMEAEPRQGGDRVDSTSTR